MIDPSDILVTDKVAIVTGGAGGIGKGIALGLARFGAHVVIADRNDETGPQTVSEIAAMGRKAAFIKTDVIDQAAVRAMVAEADARFGGIDILINNAGGVRHMPFLEMSERSLGRHVDLNMTSMFTATAEVARVMQRTGRGGAIVNVSSSEGLRAGPLIAVYAACKSAMVSFTKSMALELAADGIRVNAIAPDQCATPGTVSRREGATTAGHLPVGHPARDRYVPLNRCGSVDDSAAATVFLCSNLAGYITGVTLPVDGGTIAAGGWNRNADGEWTLYMNA